MRRRTLVEAMRTSVDEEAGVARLRPWLQNVHLPSGRQTAPEHPLGDWPRRLWDGFRDHVGDLQGKRVLDVGCNAGFYCIEAARRGAEVVGVEPNPRYLEQARFTTRAWGVEDRVTLRRAQVYELARGGEAFDVVLFLGVLYHLRYPTLALDALARVCRGRMFLQSLMTPGRPAGGRSPIPDEVDGDLSALDAPDWPKTAFAGDGLFGDPTNRWVPNPQGVEAMVRHAGFVVEARAVDHVFVCRRDTTGAAQPWAEAEFDAATGRAWHGGDSFAPLPGTLESRT